MKTKMKKSAKVVQLKKRRVKMCTGCGRIWIEHRLGGCTQCGWRANQYLDVVPLAGTESRQPFVTSLSTRNGGNSLCVMSGFELDATVTARLFDMMAIDGEYFTVGGVLKKGRFKKMITVQHNGPTEFVMMIHEIIEKAI